MYQNFNKSQHFYKKKDFSERPTAYPKASGTLRCNSSVSLRIRIFGLGGARDIVGFFKLDIRVV